MSAPPFGLAGIDHVVLLVDDMARAMAFYGDVLGCQHGYSYAHIGMEQVWAGNALIVLWDTAHPGAARAVPPVAGGRNMDHLCIATTPCAPDEMRAHLAAHGVPIEREAIHGGARGLGHSFYIRDPFGTLLEIKGPPPHPDAMPVQS